MMVATTRRVQKRMGGGEGGNDGGTGTLLEINRNVTIFQQPLPVPLASFSGIFLHPVNRAPSARPSLVSLSPSRPPGRYAGEKKRRHKRAEGGYVCRALEKNGERDSNRGWEMVAAVMYLQGNETSGGSDGKEQSRLYVGEAAKGRNEPSR